MKYSTIEIWMNKNEPTCPSCEQVLSSWDLKKYEHEGGIKLDNGLTYWIYAECPKCNITTKLMVLVNRAKVMRCMN